MTAKAVAGSCGSEIAALTHGHPTGFLSAGFFASLISALVNGQRLRDALRVATDRLQSYPEHGECLAAVERALRLADAGAASAEQVELLGKGWVADEALAIAVYCALMAEGDFELGVRLAVNHGGASDSTGSMTGNLLGAMLGEAAIPSRWLAHLELRDVIERIGLDVYKHFGNPSGLQDGLADWEKYPGW